MLALTFDFQNIGRKKQRQQNHLFQHFIPWGPNGLQRPKFILRQIPKTVKSPQVLLACPLGIQTITNFFSQTKYFFENMTTSTMDWIVTPTDLKIRQHQKRAHEECFTPWRSSNPCGEAAFY